MESDALLDNEKGSEDELFCSTNPQNPKIFVWFLILGCMIGTGLYAQPYCFMLCGIGLVISLYVFVGLITWLGAKLLVRSGEKMQVFEYSDLGKSLFGYPGKWAVEFSIVLGNFATYISYIVLLSIVCSNVIEEWVKPSFYTSSIYLVVIVTPIIAPLSMIRYYGHFSYFAQVVPRSLFFSLFLSSNFFVCSNLCSRFH